MTGGFDRIVRDDNAETGNRSRIFKHSNKDRVKIAMVGFALYISFVSFQNVTDAMQVNQIHKEFK